MLENKKEITFKPVSAADIIFQDQVIKVKPYLSLTDQIAILTTYLEEYFSSDVSAVMKSEFKLIMAVLDYATNINVEKLSLNDIMANFKLWKEINSKIVNYGEFRSLAARTIEEIKEQKRLEKSLGNVAEKILEFVNNLKEVSPEMLEKAKELLGDVEKSEVFKSAAKNFK